jgi:DNA-binding beta-propeller fold protein YncE
LGLSLTGSPSADARGILFTSNSGSLGGIESITPFTVNGDGSLVPQKVVSVGDRPEGMAITPDGRFLYVATSVSPGVRGYAIGQGGALTEVSGSPFKSEGIDTSGVAVAPSGDRLFVTNRGTGLNNAADPGSVAVYDIDPASGSLTPVGGSPFGVTGLEDPDGIAVAPDGSHVFVTGDAAGPTFDPRVAVFEIAPGTGFISQVGGSPFASGSKQAVPIVVSPNGKRVFVGNVNLVSGNTISVLDVNQETGALSPVLGSPFATAGTAPVGLAMTPDGSRLLSGERAAGFARGVSVYDLFASGVITPIFGSPFSTDEREVRGAAVSADGRRVYAMTSAEPGVVMGFSIEGGGELSPLAGSPYPTGDQFSGSFPIAIVPTQTPRPAFGPSTTELGDPTAFDASATTVDGGEATSFDWDFGDGTKLADGGPRPTHTYAALGTYRVTLTVRNDCASDAVFTGNTVFTGQTALCNGPPTATSARTLAVVDSKAPVISGLAIAGRFAPGSKPTAKSAVASAAKRIRRGAKIRYSLSETAQTTIVFERKSKTGRTKRFKKVGTLTRRGKEGRNVVPFSGRIGRRPLAPGRYRLVVTATDGSGNTSKQKRKGFSIVPAPR